MQLRRGALNKLATSMAGRLTGTRKRHPGPGELPPRVALEHQVIRFTLSPLQDHDGVRQLDARLAGQPETGLALDIRYLPSPIVAATPASARGRRRSARGRPCRWCVDVDVSQAVVFDCSGYRDFADGLRSSDPPTVELLRRMRAAGGDIVITDRDGERDNAIIFGSSLRTRLPIVRDGLMVRAEDGSWQWREADPRGAGTFALSRGAADDFARSLARWTALRMLSECVAEPLLHVCRHVLSTGLHADLTAAPAVQALPRAVDPLQGTRAPRRIA